MQNWYEIRKHLILKKIKSLEIKGLILIMKLFLCLKFKIIKQICIEIQKILLLKLINTKLEPKYFKNIQNQRSKLN